MRKQIKVTIDEKGLATCEHGGFTPLEASIILSQVIVQLQVRTAQESGVAVIHAAMPGAIRLS